MGGLACIVVPKVVMRSAWRCVDARKADSEAANKPQGKGEKAVESNVTGNGKLDNVTGYANSGSEKAVESDVTENNKLDKVTGDTNLGNACVDVVQQEDKERSARGVAVEL